MVTVRTDTSGRSTNATPDEQEAQPPELPEGRPGQRAEHARKPDAWRLASLASVPCFTPLQAVSLGVHKLGLEGQLPCGQCIGCRISRARDWTLRCVHEAELHERNCFVTLTYDQANLPSDQSLNVAHWQRFAKRLRKNVGPFRYFHCGEYGETSLRPHYHAAIFGLDFKDDRQVIRSKPHPLWRSPTLTKTWGMGHCSVGALTYESAAYVARYVMKKVTGSRAKEHYTRVDTETGEVHQVKPEYVTMSRRPGLGADWLSAYAEDVYPADEVVHAGRRHRPPRFYDAQLDDEYLEELKVRRRARVAARCSELTPDRLEQRHEHAKEIERQKDRKL